METKKDNWFKTWFDSEHYHQLYAHRDYAEAEMFINRLFKKLHLPKENSKVLDLACGKGRHSIQVNDLGYDVIGLDLSQESIDHAKQFENDRLHFVRDDMRHYEDPEHFDLILNLFTSFGYFLSQEDNLAVMKSIAKNLKPGGRLVLDYLNSQKTRARLPEQEQINRKGISFNIKKFEEDNFVVKDIQFEVNGEDHHHQEFVQLIEPNDFDNLLAEAGLKRVASFGNYQLEEFNPVHSDRYILIAAKEND